MTLEELLLRSEIDRFNADYAALLDSADYTRWPYFFTADGLYRVIGRENHEAGLPLCIMQLEGHGMMRDRVYGVSNTLFHAPYYQRHVIGAARLLGLDPQDEAPGVVLAEANYAVFRTRPGAGMTGGVSEVFNVGRYIDRFQRQPDGSLLLKRRDCVFDSEMILNSLIYPI
ncbi:aromatic-ring-hydroxylating dioxygenase subunit beta [Ferrovibrio sp.]|uniref:aromatic-ring-hydroxylating dioxygenase subunit beta n=1 Tax=Ferrovibrio sp. TaxID=1917215 RepID=UPI003D0B8A2A